MKKMKNMKNMKKTKYVGTSKNKRVMSGGGKGRQGKVSKYTQKFKNCYIIFNKISENDTDDDTKIRKMEEWGRLRGIYTYLKSKKLNESGDKTFLDQMLDNTKGSKYRQDYENVINCFEQNNSILLQEVCVPEEEYVNSKGSASEAPVEAEVEVEGQGQGQGDYENVYNPDNVKAPVKAKVEVEGQGQGQGDYENVYNPDNVKAPVKAADDTDNVYNAKNVEAPLDNQGEAADEGEAEDDEDEAADDTAENAHEAEDETEAPAPENAGESEAPVEAQAEDEGQTGEVNEPSTSVSLASIETGSTSSEYGNEKESHGGGRSKRSSRSSRRRSRGKSMKSKKGRKTRRR